MSINATFSVVQVREGCFAVDTVLFRAAVEAHAAAALAALGRAMHSSATRDRDSVLEFAHSSRDVLNSEAASLSELGEARVQVDFPCCCTGASLTFLCSKLIVHCSVRSDISLSFLTPLEITELI